MNDQLPSRIIIALLATAAAALVAPLRGQATANPSAGEIFQRALKTVDPSGAMVTRGSMHSTMTVDIVGTGITGTADSYSARPTRFVQRLVLGPVGLVESGYDGKTGWVINPATGPILMDSTQLARITHLTSYDVVQHRAETFRSVSVPNREDFDGRLTYHVHIVATTGFEYDEYFDVETGLRRGLRYEDVGAAGRAPIEILYEDFKNFDGVLIPTKITQKTPSVVLVQRTEKVEFNAVADSVFVLPVVIRALVGK